MLRDFPLVGGTAPVIGQDRPAVPVRDAATVMLVRPAGPLRAGVEVFTLRRVARMAFAAGMLVFPGGAVEEQDADPRLPWYGPAPSEVAGMLSADPVLAQAVVAAAVRETFEECGVLLAGPADGGSRPGILGQPLTDDPGWEERRHALIAGELALADLLLGAGLVVRADLLRPWAHWITPPGETRRFDTRFFVAALPDGQQARHLAGEAAQASWVRPGEALAEYAAGRLPVLPPTLVALEELAAAPSVAALLATERRIRPVSPWLASASAVSGPEAPAQQVLRVDLDGLGGGEWGPVDETSGGSGELS